MYIRNRGKNKFQGEFYDDSGEKRAITVRATSKARAKKLIEQERERRHNQSLLDQVEKVMIANAFEMWKQQDMPQSMKHHATHAYHFCGDHPIENIVDVAADYKNYMEIDGFSPCTINRRLSCVKRVARLSHTRWKRKDGTKFLPLPLHQDIEKVSEEGTERHTYLTASNVEDLLYSLKKESSKVFYLAFAYTGLRPWSQLLTLTSGKIENGSIRIDARAKNKATKARLIPISQELESSLLEHLPWQTTYSQLRNDFEQARLMCGHPEWRPYDLRHTFASWLVSDPSVPLTVVRDLLGHSSLAVTSRYSHLRDDALRDATDRLPRVNIGKSIGKN